MASPSSPFLVNVADLLRRQGAERRHQVAVPVDYRVEQARTEGAGDLTGEFVLRAIPGGIMVEGVVTVPAVLSCYRCVTEWEEEVVTRIRELVATDPDADTDYHVNRDVVDLEPLVRDEVTLALPLLPLCRPDCRGLCPACGGDLNTGACPGHDDVPTSPFAGLRDLLETQD